MKRFLSLLIPIVALLIAVPILLYLNQSTLAKIAGVITVLLTTISLRFWLYRANTSKSLLPVVKFTINERFFLNEHYPYYTRISKPEKKRLEERAGLLLSEISFDKFNHEPVTKEECLQFVIVIASLIDGMPFQHLTNKVVVFWEEESMKIESHGNKEVLFIAISHFSIILSQSISANCKQYIPKEINAVLEDFMEIPR